MRVAVAHKLELLEAGTRDAAPLVLPVREDQAVMGQTVAEFLATSGWRFDGLATVCIINGEYFSRAEWETKALAANDNVAFVSRPGQNGGNSTAKSIGSIVGMIALTALASFVVGPAALGLTGITASLTKFAIVGAGAMLLSRFLKPKAAVKSASSEQLYSFVFGTNQARPLQAIPVQYGHRLVTPDLAAPTYSEFSGDSMIDYSLFSLGCGRFSIEELRIGDTTIWTAAGGLASGFAGIELEFCEPEQQVTLFPVNVVTNSEVGGTEIGTDWLGGYAVNASGTLAKEILVDLVWPSGAYQQYKDRTLPTPVGIEYQLRTIGPGGGPTGDWFTVLNKVYSFAKQSQIRVTERIAVAPGRYELRLRRTNASITGLQLFDGKVAGTDTVTWTALRAHIDGPQSFPVSTIAVRATANAGLSGVNNGKFGVIATRILPVWNGTDLIEAPTRSIAWAALDAWRNTEYSAGLPLANVDFQAFVAYDALWTSLGHTFDHQFTDPSSLDEALETILKAGRAMPSFVGDKITIVRDEPRGLPRMMFNDNNILRGSLKIDYVFADAQFADGVIGQYLDEETWRLADVSSAPDGVVLAKPATIEIKGVGRRHQAAGLVRFHQAEHVGRRIDVEWGTGAEGKLLKRGDLVTLSCEEPETWGQSAEVDSFDAATRRVTLTAPVEWAPTGYHYAELQLRNGRPWGPIRVVRGIDDATLQLDGADLVQLTAEQGDLWAGLARSGLQEPALLNFSPGQPRSFRVLIEDGDVDVDGEHMTLRGTVDNPSVYDIAETGVPPLPSTPLVIGSGLPVVIGIGLQVVQRGVTLVLMAGWRPATGALLYRCELSYDEGATWLPAGEVDRTAIEIVVGSAQFIWFRVCGRNANGDYGGWSTTFVVPPNLVVEREFVTIKATREDFEPLLQRGFVTLQEFSGMADVAAESQLLAYDAMGAAEAGVRQSKSAIAEEKRARALLRTDVFAKIGEIGDATVQQALQAEIDARKGALATLTENVSAKFGNFGGSVEQQLAAQATINGQFVGQYIVQITSGGYVGGFQSITESGEGGTFINEFRLLTDKFLIGGPVGSGVAPEYPFTVAIVAGAARVAVRGDLVGDGTLSYRAIQTPSLSAMSADLGTVTAGNIIISGANGRMEFWS